MSVNLALIGQEAGICSRRHQGGSWDPTGPVGWVPDGRGAVQTPTHSSPFGASGARSAGVCSALQVSALGAGPGITHPVYPPGTTHPYTRTRPYTSARRATCRQQCVVNSCFWRSVGEPRGIEHTGISRPQTPRAWIYPAGWIPRPLAPTKD